MDVRATRRGVPAGVIWGGLGVLLWSAFTIFTGGAAHADEGDDGLLDGLTSVVDQTVTSIAEPVVTQVVAPVVTQVVAPVVKTAVAPVQQVAPEAVKTVTETVAAVPAVGPAAAPVVKTVADTAQAVTTPVTDLLTDSPVAQITDPILDVVAGLPVIGDLGVTEIGRDVVSVVDDAAGLIGGVAAETLPPVLEGLDPTTPGTEPAPNTPATPTDAPPVAAATGVSVTIGAGLSSAPATTTASTSGDASAPPSGAALHDDASPATLPTDGAPGGPPGAPASPTSSAGPGGGSSYAHARLSDPGVPPLRAWERAAGASDDALPASPVADTDVSPD
ncbi:hypothetical protein KZC51_02280 [Microbacterium sp. SSW1-49]|uniref:Uncharacterized protein n=1 Tax=Microbacterium croceum TaxID=2851645 RepID=A0ABT0FAA6_9MICO|nr:hypothetical protein [Microbacterium croceum]MCK2034953.1 hypothetical protein [Microbacterium croceum]